MRDPHRCVTLQLSWEFSSHWLPRNTNPVYHLWESLVISRYEVWGCVRILCSRFRKATLSSSVHTYVFHLPSFFFSSATCFMCVTLAVSIQFSSIWFLSILWPNNLLYQFQVWIKYILMKCYLILEVMTATTISCGKTNGILLN